MKNKRPKRKMALRMQTKVERKIKGVFGSPFYSQAWNNRSAAIKARILKKSTKV